MATKTPLVDVEGTATDAGAVSELLLVERATVAPPSFDSVTVQIADAPAFKVAGEHTRELTVTEPVSVTEAVCDVPLSRAEMVADWSVENTPAVAVKVALVDPAPTDTDAGTVRAELLLESATVPPLAFESVTVQVLEEFALTVAGAQVNDVMDAGVVSATDAVCELPLSEAVTVAV